jgi:hypothetical protein
MITYAQLKENKTAFAKAKATAPNTFRIAGDFAVMGTNCAYFIAVEKTTDGYTFACECKAGQSNKVCYHAAAAFIEILAEQANKQCAKLHTAHYAAGKANAEAKERAAAAERAAKIHKIEAADEAEMTDDEIDALCANAERRGDYWLELDDPRSLDFHFNN